MFITERSHNQAFSSTVGYKVLGVFCVCTIIKMEIIHKFSV